jgi:hypothetical protein
LKSGPDRGTGGGAQSVAGISDFSGLNGFEEPGRQAGKDVERRFLWLCGGRRLEHHQHPAALGRAQSFKRPLELAAAEQAKLADEGITRHWPGFR